MKYSPIFLILLISISCNFIAAELVRYDNYSVFEVSLKSKAQLHVIDLIDQLTDHYNIWKDYDDVSKNVHIMVTPMKQRNFQLLMSLYGLRTKLLISNVQELIEQEVQSADDGADNVSFGWTRYYNLQAIENWLDDILTTYPAVTESFVIGTSYEGRQIRGIKISYKAGNAGIFIESNIHAREWITSATVTWFINELLTSKNTEVIDLAENYDWYIVPVFNVDGFVYSHETDRMWRKTRQPVATSACIGTDANRNFDSHWLEPGASNNPCSGTYAGTAAFSEPETRALADYLIGIRDKIQIFFAFHSYGQYMLSPYGHSTTERPENYEHLYEIGGAFANAVQNLSYGTKYTYGASAEVLYLVTGASVDWVYNSLDVKLVYTIEFRDTGRYGFVLPPVQILPNCEELLAGLLATIDKSKQLGYV